MKLIGLTGGIGCGKTTVLEVFKSLGVPAFVADRHGAAYYDDPLFCQSIRALFGDKVFRHDGSVDKTAIAQIVFNQKDKLQQLNALVHPRVMKDFKLWAQQQTSPYVIFESAIIYEYALQDHFDAVIAVYLEKEERIKRLMLRDNSTRQMIEARMRNQLSAEEKMDRADYVVLNYEGNPRMRQVAYIDRLLRS